MTATPRPTHTYLFTLVDGGGTVPPELGTARRLVERGHRVVVLAEDSMAADVAAAGATYRPWTTAPNRPDRRPEHDPYRDWEVSNAKQLIARLLERQFIGPAGAYAEDTTAAIAEEQPDLVVSSMFALGAMVAAEAAGVPFDVLLPNAYLLPAKGMPPFGMGLKPMRGPLGALRDRALAALATRMWSAGLAGLNELRTSHGLQALTGVWEQAERARRILVLTSKAFDFTAELPTNVRYVGAVLDDPAWTSDATWSLPTGDDPVVLVALSSTFQDHAESLQRIVDALASLPVRGIVTTGPALPTSEVRPAPNVAVVEAAPHSELLGDTAVCVTHGGHGTVVRALAAGVPLLVLPHGRDQADNAVRLTSRGAGLTLKRTASPDAIAGAVRTLLQEPSFRRSAATLGAAIRADASSGALVRELDALDQRLPTA